MPRCCCCCLVLLLTAQLSVTMRRTKESKPKHYDLENCFGFNDSDVDLNLWNDASAMNETYVPMEFQQNKPYRLALYVRPSQRRLNHMNKTNNYSVARSIGDKQPRKKNECSISFKAPEKSILKKTNKKVTKSKTVMLFDENTKPENVSKSIQKTPEKSKAEISVISEPPSTRKNILKEVNTKPLTKSKQNKTRRSYERKCKAKEIENIVEPPSDEIIKELELKKITRTKPKKGVKEEQEFEKWADNMNSAFDDVEKFELSIAYD